MNGREISKRFSKTIKASCVSLFVFVPVCVFCCCAANAMVFSMVNRTWKWRNLTTEIYLFNWIKVIVSVYSVCAVCVRVCVYARSELADDEKYKTDFRVRTLSQQQQWRRGRIKRKRKISATNSIKTQWYCVCAERCASTEQTKCSEIGRRRQQQQQSCLSFRCVLRQHPSATDTQTPPAMTGRERDWAQCNAQWNEIVKYWSISGRNSMSRWWW